jgi:hypothetical protein
MLRSVARRALEKTGNKNRLPVSRNQIAGPSTSAGLGAFTAAREN